MNGGIDRKYPGDPTVKPVHLAVLEFSRFIDEDKIACGQSFALFPQNSADDVQECIKAFGWNESELIGNKTVKQMLCEDVDIRSQKVNLDKLWPQGSSEEGPLKEFIALLRRTYAGADILCVLDFARELVKLGEAGKAEAFEVPQYMVEETHVMPRIKPRFYSIVNDPFMGGSVKKTKTLEIVLSETTFKKNDEVRLGLCTNFLTNAENVSDSKVEIKCQFSSSYRVLRLPPAPADGEQPRSLLFFAHGTGIAPFISMLETIRNSNLIDKYIVTLIFGVRDNQEDLLFAE